MIQAVVSRLANNSFLMKGWALTIAGAFFGFSVSQSRAELAMISLLPTVCFWALDAYFLRCERLFRHLFAKVRTQDGSVEPFFMNATSGTFAKGAPKTVGSWRSAIFRPTLSVFYGAIAASALAVAVLSSDAKVKPERDSRASFATCNAAESSRPAPLSVSAPLPSSVAKSSRSCHRPNEAQDVGAYETPSAQPPVPTN